MLRYALGPGEDVVLFAAMVSSAALPTQPDPRRRGNIEINKVHGASLHVSHRIRIHHLLALLLTKTLIASAAWLARQWLLIPQVDLDAFRIQIRDMVGDNMDWSEIAKKEQVVHAPASIWAVATITTCLASLILLLAFRVWRWQVSWTDHTIRHLLMLGMVLFSQLLLWLWSLKYLGATMFVYV